MHTRADGWAHQARTLSGNIVCIPVPHLVLRVISKLSLPITDMTNNIWSTSKLLDICSVWSRTCRVTFQYSLWSLWHGNGRSTYSIVDVRTSSSKSSHDYTAWVLLIRNQRRVRIWSAYDDGITYLLRCLVECLALHWECIRSLNEIVQLFTPL